jgi:hypothetical protein
VDRDTIAQVWDSECLYAIAAVGGTNQLKKLRGCINAHEGAIAGIPAAWGIAWKDLNFANKSHNN